MSNTEVSGVASHIDRLSDVLVRRAIRTPGLSQFSRFAASHIVFSTFFRFTFNLLSWSILFYVTQGIFSERWLVIAVASVVQTVGGLGAVILVPRLISSRKYLASITDVRFSRMTARLRRFKRFAEWFRWIFNRVDRLKPFASRLLPNLIWLIDICTSAIVILAANYLCTVLFATPILVIDLTAGDLAATNWFQFPAAVLILPFILWFLLSYVGNLAPQVLAVLRILFYFVPESLASGALTLVSIFVITLLIPDVYESVRSALQIAIIQIAVLLPLVTVVFALWLMYMTFVIVPRLIRFRLTVLGLSFLAATIPFLNADIWQMVAGLQWHKLAYAVSLVYFAPLLIMIWDKRELLQQELSKHSLAGHTEVDINKLFENVLQSNWLETVPCIKADVSSYSSTQQENVAILTKVTLKTLLLFVTLPLLVFIFALVLFQIIISMPVMSLWLKDLLGIYPVDTTFMGYGVYLGVRVKAAVLLAFISSVATLSTLLSSEEELREFVQENFAQDTYIDRRLLIVERLLRTGELCKQQKSAA